MVIRRIPVVKAPGKGFLGGREAPWSGTEFSGDSKPEAEEEKDKNLLVLNASEAFNQ